MTVLAALLLAATFTRPMERVTTMDPAQARSLYDGHAIRLVYEPPLAIDYVARPYRLVPAYCELPQVSPDGHVYTFRTRHGSARDMVASLERLRDPAVVSPNAWMLKDVDRIVERDAHTAEVRLVRSVSYFPWLMAMPAAGIRRQDGTGTGPYELVSWRRNHEMTFRRRMPSADGFDVVRYLVVDDATTQWLMFLRGELDYLGEVSRDNWDSVVGRDGRLVPKLAEKGMRLYSVSTLESLHLGINMKDPVLGPNRKLRQALNAAFDYPEWERFYAHRIVESGGPVPPGVKGRIETPFAYRYDLGLARRLMAEAGYADGIDPKTGRRLVLTLAIGRATQESREAAELIAAFYEKVGIRLESRFYTWDAFLKAVNEARVQLFRMGWVGDYPEAQNFLQLFHSSNVSPGVNHANYVNPDYDAAYAREDWTRCQEIVREDCPWVFTHCNISFSLAGPRLGNYVPSSFLDGNECHYKVRQR